MKTDINIPQLTKDLNAGYDFWEKALMRRKALTLQVFDLELEVAQAVSAVKAIIENDKVQYPKGVKDFGTVAEQAATLFGMIDEDLRNRKIAADRGLLEALEDSRLGEQIVARPRAILRTYEIAAVLEQQ